MKFVLRLINKSNPKHIKIIKIFRQLKITSVKPMQNKTRLRLFELKT